MYKRFYFSLILCGIFFACNAQDTIIPKEILSTKEGVYLTYQDFTEGKIIEGKFIDNIENTRGYGVKYQVAGKTVRFWGKSIWGYRNKYGLHRFYVSAQVWSSVGVVLAGKIVLYGGLYIYGNVGQVPDSLVGYNGSFAISMGLNGKILSTILKRELFLKEDKIEFKKWENGGAPYSDFINCLHTEEIQAAYLCAINAGGIKYQELSHLCHTDVNYSCKYVLFSPITGTRH